jgi:hypothetical protein
MMQLYGYALLSSRVSLVLILGACASTPSYLEHRTRAFTGRIESKVELPNKSTLAKVNTVGAFSVPVFTSGKSDFIYSVAIDQSQGTQVRVGSRLEFKSGACVDVMVHELKQEGDTYTFSEATLVESKTCTK